MDPQTPMSTQSPTFMQKYKFTVISLVIILIAAIPLLLLSKKTSPKQMQTAQVVSPTPSVAPLTPQNADARLEKADTDMQQTLNQVDTDLNAAAQVDASQDSTAGL